MNTPRSADFSPQHVDDLYVRLRSGVGLRIQLVALEPPVSDVFDERFSEPRMPTYAEVIEAAELLAAARGEPWDNQQRLEGCQ